MQSKPLVPGAAVAASTGVSVTVNDDTSQETQENDDRNYILSLLLLLLLVALTLLAVGAGVAGIFYMVDRYSSSGLLYNNVQLADELMDNSTLLGEEILLVNASLCNSTTNSSQPPPVANITCATCTDNNTTLVIQGDVVYVDVIIAPVYVTEYLYINVPPPNGTLTNVTQLVQQLFDNLTVISAAITALNCTDNVTLTSGGNYSFVTAYEPYVVVYYNNSAWLSLQSNTGVPPGSNPSVWEDLGGPTTILGQQGPPGGAGGQGPNGTDATPCVNGTAGVAGGFPMEAWNASESYKPTDIVTINGSMYESLTNNTGSIPTNTSSGDWELLMQKGGPGGGGPPGPLGPDGSPPPVRGLWSNVTPYTIGDIVGSGNLTWVALTNNTNSTPNVNSTDWELEGASGTQGPPGPPGADGADCAALTTTNYTQPAGNTTFTVNVSHVNVQAGQQALIVGAGLYQVQSISGLQLTLLYSDQYDPDPATPVSTVVLAGATVYPVGAVQNSTIAGSPGPPGTNGTAYPNITNFNNSASFFHSTFCRSCSSITANCPTFIGTTRSLQFSVLTNNASRVTGDIFPTGLFNSPPVQAKNSVVRCVASNGTAYDSDGQCCTSTIHEQTNTTGARNFVNFGTAGFETFTLPAGVYNVGFQLTLGVCSQATTTLTEIDVYITTTGAGKYYDALLAPYYIGHANAPALTYDFLTFVFNRQFVISAERAPLTFAFWVEAYDAGNYCAEGVARSIIIDNGQAYVTRIV